jgi:S-disulfanyl-L-cysteine oxidoreductase SoxD
VAQLAAPHPQHHIVVAQLAAPQLGNRAKNLAMPFSARIVRARHAQAVHRSRPSTFLYLASLFGIAAISAAAYGSAHRQEAASSDSRSVWDGVYTDDQAKRGEPVYHKECASCHGDSLAGGESAPPLTGGGFLANWNGLTLGDLFDRIRKTMPQSAPGKLTRQQVSDVLAYTLSVNKFPVGKTELSKQVEFLREIRFEANKPEPQK